MRVELNKAAVLALLLVLCAAYIVLVPHSDVAKNARFDGDQLTGVSILFASLAYILRK